MQHRVPVYSSTSSIHSFYSFRRNVARHTIGFFFGFSIDFLPKVSHVCFLHGRRTVNGAEETGYASVGQ